MAESKSRSCVMGPSMGIFMQSLSVALVIWLLKQYFILPIVERALSQSIVLIGKVKHMRLNIAKFG